MENKKYTVQDGTAYYSIEKGENELTVTRFWKPVAGFGNSYGYSVYITVGAKRARIERENWTSGWATWGLPMQGSEIVYRKFIPKDTATQLLQEFDKIETETDELERKALIVELAKKVMNLLEKLEEEDSE